MYEYGSYSRIIRNDIAGLDCVMIIDFDIDEPGDYTPDVFVNPDASETDDVDVFIVQQASIPDRVGVVIGVVVMIIGLGAVMLPTLQARLDRRTKGSSEAPEEGPSGR